MLENVKFFTLLCCFDGWWFRPDQNDFELENKQTLKEQGEKNCVKPALGCVHLRWLRETVKPVHCCVGQSFVSTWQHLSLGWVAAGTTCRAGTA